MAMALHAITLMVLLRNTFVGELVLCIAVDMRIISEIFGTPIRTHDGHLGFFRFRHAIDELHLAREVQSVI